MWDMLYINFQARMKFLKQATQISDPKQVYQLFECETAALADLKNDTMDIYQLISKKETNFGNVLTPKYHQVEHKSELFSLRADIQRKIEDY
jgi:hypothetical protein